MSFTVNIPLYKFEEMGETLEPGNALLCGNYPCEFISQEVKPYTYDNEREPIETMLYKVKFTTSALYKKGKTVEVIPNDLHVIINVQKWFVDSANDKN